ncbi:MAG: hypothetical protein M3R13_11615 [Armatimonadota bacterium]|nr:hypothetical protein [Armatimonadota bacterium]
MERSRREKKGAEKIALQKRRWIIALGFAPWYVALYYLLKETGFEEAVRKATEPWEQSPAGLLIVLFFAPVVFAAIKYVDSDYTVPETVPKPLRLTVFVFQGMARGFAVAGCYLLLMFSLRFVPILAILIGLLSWLAVVIGILIRQFFLERAAKKTVTALYEAIKNDEQEVLSGLCEPEAAEGLAALDSRAGKLTWYRVMNVMLEERHFTFMVESIRNRMPKFEEVTIKPGGNRVVNVMAEGI